MFFPAMIDGKTSIILHISAPLPSRGLSAEEVIPNAPNLEISDILFDGHPGIYYTALVKEKIGVGNVAIVNEKIYMVLYTADISTDSKYIEIAEQMMDFYEIIK